MINGKFLATLTALIAIVFAICNFNTKTITENFWTGPGRRAKRNIVTSTKRGLFNIPPSRINYSNPRLQASLSTGTLGYANGVGPNIRYNCPPQQYMARPRNERMDRPASSKRQVKEEYCGCGVDCDKNGSSPVRMNNDNNLMPANYADGNYNSLVDQVDSKSIPVKVHEALPVENMNTINALGETQNVVNFNRVMFANQKSRLQALGDPIRGDLPITPCNTGWFQVSVNPNLDLQAGAMNVMGGITNETNNATSTLINSEVGQTAIGGVNLSNQQLATISAGTDVGVTMGVDFNTFQ